MRRMGALDFLYDINVYMRGDIMIVFMTRHKFVCFDVTSHIDIDCARSSLCPCVRLACSVGRASEGKSEGRGFESHARLILYLESKNRSTTLNMIYIHISRTYIKALSRKYYKQYFHEL